MKEENSQNQQWLHIKFYLFFFFFLISFCKGGCISKPRMEVTSSGCWGSQDQPSLKIKAKDCNAARVEGELQQGRDVRGQSEPVALEEGKSRAPQGQKASSRTQQLQLPSSCPRLAGKARSSWGAELGGTSQDRAMCA